MRFLTHPQASQKGNGHLVAGVDGCEHPMLVKGREQVVEQGDHRQRAEALALVCGRNGEADLDLAAVGRQEVHAEITQQFVRGRRSDSQLIPGIGLVKWDGPTASNEGPGSIDGVGEP